MRSPFIHSFPQHRPKACALGKKKERRWFFSWEAGAAMSDKEAGFFMADAMMLLMLCLMIAELILLAASMMERMDSYVVEALLSY